jgi:transcriptional regulator with XRE-family HTH domain
MPEQLGRRIARLRAERGLTQQELAERLAISRVAVSHLESGISTPSERTVTLLAGLFKLEPLALVADTFYPEARAERLPLVVCRYTEAELLGLLLEGDGRWLSRLRGTPGWRALALDTCQRWFDRLEAERRDTPDAHERGLLDAALAQVRAWQDAALAGEGRRAKGEGPEAKRER